jgi:hypothetical protein
MIDFKKLIYLPIDIPNPPNIVNFLNSVDNNLGLNCEVISSTSTR